jgi:beta-glucosidase
LKGSGSVSVSVTVTNNGSRDGKHSVELYTHQQYASITPNMRRLRAFQKINLKAGETQTVSFTITAADLAFVNAGLKTVTEAGDFDIMIGDQKASFRYTP